MPTTPSYQNNAAPYAAPESVDNEEDSPDARRSKPLYMSNPFIKAALVKGNFKTIVMLPKYTDIMEWVAVNSALVVPPLLFYP